MDLKIVRCARDPTWCGVCRLPQEEIQLRGVMLDVPHIVEDCFSLREGDPSVFATLL